MQDTKKCILAIDDTPMQLHALIKILQPTYTVRVAKDGESGLDFVKKYDIDLILLDMIMPGISGLEVLYKLKESDETKNIPVILATGNTAEEDRQEGLRLGAADYIYKPFDEAILLSSVTAALNN